MKGLIIINSFILIGLLTSAVQAINDIFAASNSWESNETTFTKKRSFSNLVKEDSFLSVNKSHNGLYLSQISFSVIKKGRFKKYL